MEAVWIRLPTNQGLKHEYDRWKFRLDFGSESDFQQIKDWNGARIDFFIWIIESLNPTSNKSRIETRKHRQRGWPTAKVWIRLPTNQGLKHENAVFYFQLHFCSLNPTSNKSRIETLTNSKRFRQVILGLNPTSNKSRIETSIRYAKNWWRCRCLNPTSNKSRIETQN